MIRVGWLILSCVLLSAQPTAYPLEKLTITGADRIQTDRIVSVLGLKIGQPVTKANFDAARERLVATGAFENVGYEFKPSATKTGYDATFQLMEILQMFPYRFEDLPASDADLQAAIHAQEPLFADQIPFTPQVMVRYESVLAKVLQGKAEVKGALNYANPDQPVIVFRPPGDMLHISDVHFSGNSVLTTEQLSSKMIQVAFGSDYTEALTRKLLESAIRPMYEAKGQLRVAFPKVSAAPTAIPDVIGVAVSITVDEGAEYKLAAVTFQGVDAKLRKDIENLADFKKDEAVNFDEVEKGLERIRKRYRGNGFLHVKASTERTLHEQDHTVDLLVKIEPGPQFVYGKLDIQGLDLLSEPPIRKAWGNRTGKPFDPTAANAFLKEIGDQQVFDNLKETKAVTKLNEDSKTADVTLIFTGGRADAKPTRRAPGQTQ